MSPGQMDRRSLLRGMTVSGAALGLDASFTAAPSAAAQIGPTDRIKVTALETFVLTNSWVFVKISTDAGIVGWGEMLKDDAKACAAGAQEVARYLVGQNPLRVVHHWQAIHRGAFYRGGPIKTAILSGIDQALWDIKGKAFGVPIHELLGGPTRDRVRVYGTVSAETGVTAMKVGPNGEERQAIKYVEGKKFVDEVVERFRALREKYGDGVDIGIDFHGAVQPPTALLLMKALEPYNPGSTRRSSRRSTWTSWRSSRARHTSRSRQASASSRSGASGRCSKSAPPPSCSPMSATPAASPS